MMMMFLVKPVCLASLSNCSANSTGTLKPIGLTPRLWSDSLWVWLRDFGCLVGILIYPDFVVV